MGVGVDWITGTSPAGYSRDEFDAVCGALLVGDHQADNFARPRTLLGYDGLVCGQAFVGERPDGCLVQVTGDLAATHWRYVADFCPNIPRVDLQLTVRDSSDPYVAVRRVDQRLRRAKKRRGRGPEIRFERSENGGATTYVGCKSSRRYGRVYNKHAESGLAEFEGCVRWEGVFREDLGRTITRFVQRCPAVEQGIFAVLRAYFEEVGAGFPSIEEANSSLRLCHDIFCSSRKSDARRQLEWLRRQVRPTIERLRSCGYSQSLTEALGMVHLDDLDTNN